MGVSDRTSNRRGTAKRAEQIDELKVRNRELEAKLLMAGTGERDTMPTKQKVTNRMVVGDSIVRNFGAVYEDMKVECFPGIKTEQLHRVMEKRDLDFLLFSSHLYPRE